MTLWVNICFIASYIIFELQMLIIWLFFTRKSDLHTTIVDMVNCDTLILHNMTFSMIYIIVKLLYDHRSGPTFIPDVIIQGYSIFFSVVTLTCYMYYSIGIALRYYLVLKQTTCLSETFTDEQIQIGIRCATATISVSLAIDRTIRGEYIPFYFIMTNKEGNNQSGFYLIAFVLSLSVIINIVCRTLIYLEKRKFQDNHFRNSNNFKKSAIGIIILAIAALSAVLMQLNAAAFGNYIYTVRFIWIGVCLNIIPFVYIIVTKDLIMYIKVKFGLNCNAVSPE